MNKHHYGIIMAGGVGSRFWPLSREACPKQFLDLTKSGKTFLRQAYERFLSFLPQENIIVVSLSRYEDAVKKVIPELEDRNLLLEPYGRNTAPCLAYATYSLLKRDPEAVMAVSPADHVIKDLDSFKETMNEALDYASRQRALITLGIVPDRPDTNFGYIQVVGGQRAYEQNKPVKVKTFTEKPDAELADVFVKSGEFLWNSGIFVWKAETIREEMERHIPAITNLFKGWEIALGCKEERRFLEKAYMNMERISIDYAVMEKTDIDWLYPANFEWADIGNWESLYAYMEKHDDMGNAFNTDNILFQEVRRSIIYTDNSKKLMAVSGLDDFVVIDTADALMICPRNDRKLKDITIHIGLPDYEEFR